MPGVQPRAGYQWGLPTSAGGTTGRGAGLKVWSGEGRGGGARAESAKTSSEAAGGAGSAVRGGGWRPALGTSGDLKRQRVGAHGTGGCRAFSLRGGGARFSAKGTSLRGLSGRARTRALRVHDADPPAVHGGQAILPTMASGDDSPIFEDDESPPYSLEKMTDLVAVWDVALSDGVHKIEFEHGTTSGKRVVYVDGKEEIRKEWMFKLVGKETFCVGAAKTKATINIDAISGFAYEYTLEINGKSLKKYMENRSKTTNTWVLHLDGEDFRIVLEKDTMDVWCNGKRMETAGEFVDDGTETHFSVGNHDCYIKAVSSGKRKEGIIHSLIVDDREIPEILE